MPLNEADITALSRLLDDAGDDLDAWRRNGAAARLPDELAHLAAPLQAMRQARTADLVYTLPLLAEPVPADLRAGERVGPYRLLRRIGAGGMGTVWLAARDDGLYERQVALKLPHAAWDDRLAQRMRQERRAAARLAHPHIARLYDAGVDDQGRPYMAMAWIDGVPIDQWCRESRPTVHELLRLFVPIVDAVAHAHGRQVVHRDIKPANILVDADGQAHLLDFGIAKLLDDEQADAPLSLDTSRVMSAAYAAPEQFLAQPVTPATDLYALGVTLFELLTGRRPHADARAGLTPACTVDTAPPASSVVDEPALRRALRGDVDAILARALQTGPADRYASAQAMADDLRRHLAGQAISARPDTALCRGLRYAVRHPRELATLLAFAALLAAAAAALWLQARQGAEQADTARIVQGLVAQLLQLDGVRPAQPVAADGAGQLLQRATALIETRSAHRPALQADLYGAIARVYLDMGAGGLAADLAQRQLATLQRMDAPADRRCRALLLLAESRAEQKRYAEATARAREALALQAVRTPAGLEAHAVLAALLLGNGNHDEARSLVESAERAWRGASDPPAIAMAMLLDVRARLLEKADDYAQAVRLWQRAIRMAVAAEGDESALANRIRIRMALEDLARSRSKEAESGFQAAIASLEAGGDAGRLQAARASARYAGLAFSMAQMPYAQAHEQIERARRTVAGMGAALPEDLLARIEVQQGWLALRWGDLATARRLLPRAAAIVERSTDGLIDRRALLTYQAALAMISGEHARADPLLRQRLVLRVQSGDGRTPFAVVDWEWLSHNLLMRGDIEGAWRVLQEAPAFPGLADDRNAGGAAYANALPEQRARVLLARGDAAGALAALPAPYGLQAQADLAETFLTPYALRGEVLCAAGRPAEGLPFLQQSMDALAPALSPSEPRLARVRSLAGLCALALGHTAQARQWAAQARAAFQAQPQVSAWFRQPLRRLEQRLAPQPPNGAAAESPALAGATD